jgi:hypothetical protein
MQAHSRLGVLLTGRAFTGAEDRAILAWVEEHGPTGWTELAYSLGRTSTFTGGHIRTRYQILADERDGKRKDTKGRGSAQFNRSFSLAEEEVILREVMEQNPWALEEMLPGSIDWASIAELLNRPQTAVHRKYMLTLHPTLRLHLAGTLEEDVRLALVKRVKEQGWVFGADIDYTLVAGMPGFEGHTRASLHLLYNHMTKAIKEKLKLASMRDVRVEQVESYLMTLNSQGQVQRKMKQEWEQEVVAIHRRLLAELRREE